MARLGRDRAGLRFGVGLAVAMGLAGCGSPASDIPLKSAKAGAMRKGTKPLEIVPISRNKADADAMKASTLIQAGFDTLKVQTLDTAPGKQADTVREAIRREPPVLIVEAPASPDVELDRAVGEARTKGLPIVALGRPLGEPSAGPGREVVVTARPFGPTAARLVELAMRNAVNGKLDPKAGALLIVRPDADPLARDRIAALKEALQAAGIASVEEVALPDDPKAGPETVAEAVRAHAGVTLVLASDGQGVSAADHATGIVKQDRPYVIAGYTDNEQFAKTQTTIGEYAGVGLYLHDRLFRKGVNVAAHLLRGDKVADRVEVDTLLMESPLYAALPKARIEPEGGKRPLDAE